MSEQSDLLVPHAAAPVQEVRRVGVVRVTLPALFAGAFAPPLGYAVRPLPQDEHDIAQDCLRFVVSGPGLPSCPEGCTPMMVSLQDMEAAIAASREADPSTG